MAQCSAALRSGCCRTLVAHRAALGQDARHRQRDQGYTANAEQPRRMEISFFIRIDSKPQTPKSPKRLLSALRPRQLPVGL